MKNELSLYEPRRTGVLAHLGILSAAITVAVFSTLFFADLAFTVMAGLRFALHLILLCFASYMMYFSLSEVGVDRAKTASAFEEGAARLRLAVDAARRGYTMKDIRCFCADFSARETAERRALILSAYTMDEEGYHALLQKPAGARTRRERRLIRCLEKMAPVYLSPAMLLSDRVSTRLSAPLAHTPSELRLRRTLLFLIPTALTALFSVSVVCRVIAAPNANDVVGYLLKLFTLFYNGAKGYRDGYRHITEDRLPYMEERAEILEEFLRLAPPSPRET